MAWIVYQPENKVPSEPLFTSTKSFVLKEIAQTEEDDEESQRDTKEEDVDLVLNGRSDLQWE